jgi:predicted AlkP superfamily pyrophosphatase or phosphodiesterase
MRAGDYDLSLPNIEALRARGSWAEGVVGQYPSDTYPSHTSIVTGVRPARHGVTQNTSFEPTGQSGWHFESSAIKVPTLWDAANRAGLITAGVSWPVTVGAPIDVLFPESHQFPAEETWLDLARSESTPGLVDAVVEALGGFPPDGNRDPQKRDVFATAAAVHMIETAQPHLLLIHLVQTDYAQHARGRHSPEAKLAFANVEAHVGEIVAAVQAAGLGSRTAFVVTGDHGYYRIHSTFQPNVVLRRAGLLETDPEDKIVSWRAAAHGGAVKLADRADQDAATRALAAFRQLTEGQYRGLFRLVERAELDALGADPEAVFFVEPIDGYSVGGGFSDDAFLRATGRRGSHGFLPTAPAMHTGLVISGAGIRAGVAIPLARQIDIAPTVAALLGLEFGDVDGVPMMSVISPDS